MKGFYSKYIVLKADGSPVDPEAQYVVLRIDDGTYVDACRAGVQAFADRVRRENPQLADGLEDALVIASASGAGSSAPPPSVPSASSVVKGASE